MEKMKKKNYFFAMLLLITVMGIVGVVKMNTFKNTHSFTQEKWLQEPNERYLIVDDMVKKYDFENMTMDQVIQLLGNVDKKFDGLFSARLNKEKVSIFDKNSVFYFIKKGKVPEEVKGFYVKFNSDNKVIDYAILDFRT